MPQDISHEPVIAVLLPCYNEELTIAEVVRRFRETLPAATIYVYDNNSKDLTAL
ncbi:MAG: glycosyltransferase, partial [Mesorhizobium sp.]